MMRCRKCGAKAAINMRHHKLALCGACYVVWFREQTERTIDKYKMFSRGERVLVAVSGGKDSLALWDVLDHLGYQADGMYIGLGIDGGTGYSDESKAMIDKFLFSRPHLTLHEVDVAETYGRTIPEVAEERRRGKPCSVCGLTKRHVMNRVALEGKFDALATGHNLDDEAAVLFQNTIRWQAGYLARQSPVLPAERPGLARKVKPFFRFYERETAAYALLTGIEYIYEECPHAAGNTMNYYKTLLNQLEGHSPGAKLSFYLSFLKAREQYGLFADARVEADIDMHPCEQCGQPTTAPGMCAFCRQWEAVGTGSGLVPVADIQ
jgi:tRNA-5-methyluridine54 2-sulfurtransferase